MGGSSVWFGLGVAEDSLRRWISRGSMVAIAVRRIWAGERALGEDGSLAGLTRTRTSTEDKLRDGRLVDLEFHRVVRY